METKRLSLDAFKTKANNVETGKVLEKVQGGSWSDCHGYWGQMRKIIVYKATGVDEGIEWGE